jgi:hypothetical protein
MAKKAGPDPDRNGGEDIVWYASSGADWVWRYAAGHIFGAQAGTNISLRSSRVWPLRCRGL